MRGVARALATREISELYPCPGIPVSRWVPMSRCPDVPTSLTSGEEKPFFSPSSEEPFPSAPRTFEDFELTESCLCGPAPFRIGPFAGDDPTYGSDGESPRYSQLQNPERLIRWPPPAPI